jgi:hypothetical protein
MRRVFVFLCFLLTPFAIFAHSLTENAKGQVLSVEAALGLIRAERIESLGINEMVQVLTSLNSVPDRIDRRKMSIRWTGKLRVPAGGNYVFEQLMSSRNGSRMALWINNNLVLDTRQVGGVTRNIQNRSQPVPITSGEVVDFRLDFVHDSPNVNDFPVAVLTWESEVLERQIVPSIAFSLPDGNRSGLRGEYYADTTWGRRIADRTDENVDFIWESVPVENGFSSECRRIISANFSRVTNDSFLASLVSDGTETVHKEFMPQLFSGMTASGRLVFADAILKQPDVLKGVSLRDIVSPIRTVGILSRGKQIDLFLAWTKVNPQPRSLPGSYISGFGSYVTKNVSLFEQIGESLGQGRSFADIMGENETLFVLPNGECNLAVIYAFINSGKSNGYILSVVRAIDMALESEENEGDIRMTWLLARAYAKEVGLSQLTKPGRGLPELRLALAEAESSEYRFWAFQEIVARLITLDRTEEARSLILSFRDQFPDRTKQALIDQWLEEGERLSRIYMENRQETMIGTLRMFSDEMNRRGDRALQSGDTDATREFRSRANQAR